ncbi:MAG: sensor histidine kinase [Cyanobacteria bacterium J06627_8]
MSASPEFIQICQAQFGILSDVLGASLCIVYLNDALPGEGASKLVPVLAYPEDLMPWAETELLSWIQRKQYPEASLIDSFTADEPSRSMQVEVDRDSAIRDVTVELSVNDLNAKQHLAKQSSSNIKADRILNVTDSNSDSHNQDVQFSAIAENRDSPSDSSTLSIAPLTPEASVHHQHQIALPLIYEGIMVGLLVTGRPDRFWTDQEHDHIEQIAKTLSISSVVDRRERWLEEQLHTQARYPSPTFQRNVFDDLIHQFRNPLTAMRTFGKLLMRRLPSSDRNFGVAESIVRESDRLQELLQYFKVALDQETPQMMDSVTAQLPPALFPQADGDAQGVSSASEQANHHVDGGIYHSAESLSHESTIDVSSSATYLTGHDITPVSCGLTDVLAPLVDVAWAIAQDKDIALSVELAPNASPVSADPKGLQEVFSNLIDNAVKYTPSGGHVLIRVPAPQSEHQAVIVADTGPGIPDADQERLFERHFRGVQEAGDIPGTGLGLAIAHDLIEKMEGIISAYSPVSIAPLLSDWSSMNGASSGTAFIVWLKRADRMA